MQQPHVPLVNENPTGVGSVARVPRAAENFHRRSQVSVEAQHGETEVCELLERARHQGAVIPVMTEIKKVMMENPNVRLSLRKARGNRAQ